MPAPARPVDPIDAILALDLGGRGIGAFFTPGAAVAAARALTGAERVVIVTGFSVPPGLPETDGPPGAAVLGRALRLLGATVHYVTDPAPVAPMSAALRALGEPPEVIVYPDAPDAARTILDRTRPTHLISIERPGRGRTGDYLSARAESIKAWNLPLDDLFVLTWKLRAGASANARAGAAGKARSGASGTAPGGASGKASRQSGKSQVNKSDLMNAARSRRAQATHAGSGLTLGIGDGGNEIGMGSVFSRVARSGPLMARIASVVPVDHLVVAGTSNWGAYGIVAALERLHGRALLHTGADERRVIERCVEAGAVDGLTRKREPTVDGLAAEVHAGVVDLLHAAAARSSPGKPAGRGIIGR